MKLVNQDLYAFPW